MFVTSDRVSLLALLRIPGVSWSFVAREASRPEGLDRLLVGASEERSRDATESITVISGRLARIERLRTEAAEIIETTSREGIKLTTVLDEDYPLNLRTIFNLPPFLFYRGTLKTDDARAVAVVGTREASELGLERARKMARLLAEQVPPVTVLSGLARGIDTAAHQACLAAGGRTVAVLGSGIRRIYPPENVQLADEITQNGAVVSQFWPDAPPSGRFTFALRNAVMSGMGQGTVVVEASATSGAKMQARLALEHGKKVWLLRSLVEEREWAKEYISRGAVAVEGVEEIVGDLESTEKLRERAGARAQLALSL
jgi:DNA processing protein